MKHHQSEHHFRTPLEFYATYWCLWS